MAAGVLSSFGAHAPHGHRSRPADGQRDICLHCVFPNPYPFARLVSNLCLHPWPPGAPASGPLPTLHDSMCAARCVQHTRTPSLCVNSISHKLFNMALLNRSASLGLTQPRQSLSAPARPAVSRSTRRVDALAQHQRFQVTRVKHQQQLRRSLGVCKAAETEAAQVEPKRSGVLISTTEVPAFIQRDDMMDQLIQWAVLEAGENGMRNFGMPMRVERRYKNGVVWGFQVEVFKDGDKRTDLGINFDDNVAIRSEYIGQGPDGFPTKEGTQSEVEGANLEIWCAWGGAPECIAVGGDGDGAVAIAVAAAACRRCMHACMPSAVASRPMRPAAGMQPTACSHEAAARAGHNSHLCTWQRASPAARAHLHPPHATRLAPACWHALCSPPPPPSLSQL